MWGQRQVRLTTGDETRNTPTYVGTTPSLCVSGG